ncbi:MAG: prepilin-type N-terminal cleavage/methylation domain-containing protein [Deltaproteobacteria bacterium]|nr:prepilin-type N-terminal cleavage/methylation domain-containing protein [Deltaproteobacteria bacterium]
MHEKLQENHLLPAACSCHRVFATRFTDRGFTLLEIMIAISIFAIIATTIFASYSSLLSGNETSDQGTASYEMAKNCLNRMIVDLESIHLTLPPGYSPPVLGEPPEPYRIVGEIFDIQGVSFPRLRFTSLAHLSLGGKTEKGIAEIVYYVQSSGDGNYVLKRADNLYPYETFEEKAKDPVLCAGVKSLTFKYYDQDGTAYDLWDSDDEEFGYSTPRAIDINLELAESSNSLWFKTMVTLPVYRKKKE